MKAAIIIDGVLRDYIDSFYNVYSKSNGEIEGLELSSNTEYNTQVLFGMSDEDYKDFLEEHAIALKGYAEEIKRNVVQNDLSRLADILEEKNIELWLVDDAINKEVPATYLFLSAKLCYIKNIKMTKSYEGIDDYDLIITSLPNVIIDREDKCIKINTSYNDKTDCERNSNSIKDLVNDILESKINL